MRLRAKRLPRESNLRRKLDELEEENRQLNAAVLLYQELLRKAGEGTVKDLRCTQPAKPPFGGLELAGGVGDKRGQGSESSGGSTLQPGWVSESSYLPKGRRERNLSHRERQVLKLFLAGMPHATIAGILNISASTVNNHVCAIFNTTGTRCRVDLAAWAKRNPAALRS